MGLFLYPILLEVPHTYETCFSELDGVGLIVEFDDLRDLFQI